jgi:predicted P-loop ATPase
LRFVYYESEKPLPGNPEANKPQAVEDSWAALYSIFKTLFRETDCKPCPSHKIGPNGKKGQCAAKLGRAWSPVVLKTLPGDAGPKRSNDNVEAITAAVVDLDGLTEDQVSAVSEALNDFEYIAHSTHSHRPPEFWCLRVVLPLSREVSPKEWERLLRAIVSFFKLPADPSCKDPSRLYFLPSIPRGFDHFLVDHHGRSIDVDAFLTLKPEPVLTLEDRQAEEEGSELQAAGYTAPESLEIAPAIDCLKKARAKYARSRKDGSEKRYKLIDRVIEGKPLAKPSDPETPRSTSINQAASIIAFALPFNAPVELALELLRPSLASMGEDLQPEGMDHWLGVARNSYQRSMRRREKAMQARDEFLRFLDAKFLGKQPQSTDILAPAPDEDWIKLLIRDEKGKPRSCGYNVGLVLENRDGIKGTIKFNEVTKDIDVFGGPFSKEHADTLHVGVANWLQKELELFVKSHEVESQIARVARFNSYDPLADYLNGLRWDGKPRLNNALVRYFGARTVDDSGKDLSQYLDMIGPRWFIAAAARGLRPGEKVDYVLVLEGLEGIRKSTGFKVLGGDFFTDTPINMRGSDKDTTMVAGQVWIAELAELACMKMSETEAQKNFITRGDDLIRVPYGKRPVKFKRRCVFVGTTNETKYLISRTGNRRFWPVWVEWVDLEGLRRDRDQIWAEAVARFRAGERFWIEPHEAELVRAQTAERSIEIAYTDAIREWWLGMDPNRRPRTVTSYEVAQIITGEQGGKISHKMKMDCGEALLVLGFTKGGRGAAIGGHRPSIYLPSDDLLRAPKANKKAPHLNVVAGTAADPGVK